MARVITDVYWRAQALTDLAAAAAQAGADNRARYLIRLALELVSGIAIVTQHAQALSDLAGVVAQAGDNDRADALARDISDSYWYTQTLSDLAVIAAEAGNFERAENLASTITDSYRRAQTLTELVGLAAVAGNRTHADELINTAESLVITLVNPFEQTQVVTDLAVACAQVDPECARQLFDLAASFLRATGEPTPQLLTSLANAATRVGDYERAETLAQAITDPYWQGQALAAMANSYVGDAAFDEAAKSSRIRRLLAQSLAAAPWEVSLIPLVRVAPLAVITLAEEYESLINRQQS